MVTVQEPVPAPPQEPWKFTLAKFTWKGEQVNEFEWTRLAGGKDKPQVVPVVSQLICTSPMAQEPMTVVLEKAGGLEVATYWKT